jgi:hypothetical protein
VRTPEGAPAGAGVRVVALLAGEDDERVLSDEGYGPIWSETRTRDDGTFTVVGLDAGERYTVSAAGQGLLSNGGEVTAIAGEAEPVELATSGFFGIRWSFPAEMLPGNDGVRLVSIRNSASSSSQIEHGGFVRSSAALLRLPAYRQDTVGQPIRQSHWQAVGAGERPKALHLGVSAPGWKSVSSWMQLEPILDEIPFHEIVFERSDAKLVDVHIDFVRPRDWPASAALVGWIRVADGEGSWTTAVDFTHIDGMVVRGAPEGATFTMRSVGGLELTPVVVGPAVGGTERRTFDLAAHPWVRIAPLALADPGTYVQYQFVQGEPVPPKPRAGGRPQGSFSFVGRSDGQVVPLVPAGRWHIVIDDWHTGLRGTSATFDVLEGSWREVVFESLERREEVAPASSTQVLR